MERVGVLVHPIQPPEPGCRCWALRTAAVLETCVDEGLEIDGFHVEAEALRFAVCSEQAWGRLVGLRDSGSGVPGLRERGLISDSPRVLARENRARHVEGGT